MADIILRGGTLVDGSGDGPFLADVAITGGRIEAVGRIPRADAELALDVGGLIVAPGFIDSHSHADAALLDEPMAVPKVAQGVTTEVVGNCGFGPFPVLDPAALDSVLGVGAEGAPWVFRSVREYRTALRDRGTAVNIAALLPHGPLRKSVVGVGDRPSDEQELRHTCRLAHDALKQGAVGISFGLLYAPGCFTPKEEIVALGRVAAAFSRPIVFHVRNECDRFEESVVEAIEIGAESGAAVHISHLKVADPANWGRVGVSLAHIEEANQRGRQVTCDSYPYTAGSSPFTTLLPPWALDGGIAQTISRLRDPAARSRISAALSGEEHLAGWDNLSSHIGWERCVVGSAPGLESWEGRTIADIAAASPRHPHDVFFELLLTTNCTAIGIWHQMCEEDVQAVIRHSAQMVGSDGLHTPGKPSERPAGKPHPRLWGTFPRLLGHYARDLGLLTLEQAVHKMTARAAATFGLRDRGLLRPGCHADICVFDPGGIADRATYDNPTQPPEGIAHVICSGVPTMLDGRRTEQRPGAWLG